MSLLELMRTRLLDVSLQLWVRFVIAAEPTPTPTTSEDIQTIESFFKNLFTNGIKPVGYAIAVCFFGWAAISLMFPGERHQDNAKMALYRAIAGVVLILLTEAIVNFIQSN